LHKTFENVVVEKQNFFLLNLGERRKNSSKNGDIPV